MAQRIRDYLETRTARPAGLSSDGETVLIGANLTGTMQLYNRARRRSSGSSPA